MFSSCSSFPSEPVDLDWVCTAFFALGLQPRGCTKQVIKVQGGAIGQQLGQPASRLAVLRKSLNPL
jgi:hypothetical protein